MGEGYTDIHRSAGLGQRVLHGNNNSHLIEQVTGAGDRLIDDRARLQPHEILTTIQ
jgi:hypothetical protein